MLAFVHGRSYFVHKLLSWPFFQGVAIWRGSTLSLLFSQDFNTDSQPVGNQGQPEFSPDVEAKEDSDMEGWDDDEWGDIESSNTTQTVPSSGADFFDAFDSKPSNAKPKTEQSGDFFDNVPGHWSAKNTRTEKTPPPPVSASLFSGKGGASVGAGGGDGWDSGGGGDGWGDWNEDFKEPQKQVIVLGFEILDSKYSGVCQLN